MRAFGKIALWLAGIVIGLPIVLLLGALAILNVAPGHRWIERIAGPLTGGQIKISGLHGRFPDALRVDHVALTDAGGTWAKLDGVVLNWSPTALFVLRAQIKSASIDHLIVLRRPLPAANSTPPAQGPFSLPVSIDVGSFHVARADIAAPVAGPAFSAMLDATAYVASMQQGRAAVSVTRLDRAGSYRADASMTDRGISGQLSAQEPAQGLLSALAGLPDLGAIAVTAAIDGPKSAETAHVDLSAGPLHAIVAGTVDLPGQRINADVAATAPSMHPRPDIGWRSIDLHAQVAGSFTAPDVKAQIAIADLSAGGTYTKMIEAGLTGNNGTVRLHAVVSGTRVPGKQPDLFAQAPIVVDADIDLAGRDRPLRATLTHTLLTAELLAKTKGAVSARIDAILPDIAPLAAAGGAALQGRADLTANLTTQADARQVTLAGTADITGGQAPMPGLLGPSKIDAAATLNGANITLQHATIDGRALHAEAAGSVHPDAVALSWHATLPDLSAVWPRARGAVTLDGAMSGPPGHLSLTSTVKGEAGSRQFAKTPVEISLTATDLPSAPTGRLRGTFRLRDADARLEATATTGADGAIHAIVSRADWKSFAARADIVLPKSSPPTGKLDISAGELADIAAFISQPISGRIKSALHATATEATVQLDGSDLALGTRRIATLSLNGRATGAQSDPDMNATLALAGIDADGIEGAATITARGHQNALQLRATADAPSLQGAPARLDTAALLNARMQQITLQTFNAGWKAILVRLQAPARIDFGQQIAVDQLRLALNTATLEARGRVSPTLDLSANLRHFTADILQPLAPQLAAAGTLSLDARLTGSPPAPSGTLHVNATGLRIKTGPAAAIPPATITATVLLNGNEARIDAHADAGPKLRLAADGTVPLQQDRALALVLRGNLDISLLNPLLQTNGSSARGRADLNLAVAGTIKSPLITGRVGLADGELRDYAQGLDLRQIGATIEADGNKFLITHFSASAGPGSIGVSGTVGARAPYPVDLHISARNARPLASDLLTALFDADLSVHGAAEGDLNAAGKILLHRMDINIPDALPPSVAQLNVRRPGQAPSPPAHAAAPPQASVHLAIDVDAPSNIFVRGKGLYAELGGKLKIAGTTSAPLIEGSFDMRRGDFSLAGTTLTFTRGAIGFNGSGVTGKIDPTLDFQADSIANGIVATLHITGYADAPKIALSSVPDLPQDEIVAQLLFGTNIKQLSPFQLAEIGAALAELSGVVGGEGPLGTFRKRLGLDRLSVGGGTGGGASVEAGRYVAKGVYVGTKQGAGGAGGTQVQVQIDLTRHLKLNAALGSGGATAQGATPENDPGSSVGLSYQFEY
jgi:translocation and assembly module TamB